MANDSIKDDPIRPELSEPMNELARVLSEVLPDGVGFALLVFDFGKGGFMNYISNSERADVVRAMREFIARAEGN